MLEPTTERASRHVSSQGLTWASVLSPDAGRFVAAASRTLARRGELVRLSVEVW